MQTQDASSRFTLQQHLIYICSRFLTYFLPMILFLVVTSFYLKTYDSAQIKITFTQTGCLILAMVWLAKILLEGKSPFDRSDLFYVAPFLLFLLSGLAAFVHTPFKGWSSEETSRRLFYMIIALVTISEMRSAESMARVHKWLLAAAWVAIGYGFLQYMDSRFFKQSPQGLDPFIWRQAFGPRVFSTFGNPNFYGNFLVIMTPIVLASVLRSKGPLIRPFMLLVVTLGLVLAIDKSALGLFGGVDPSFRVIYGSFLVLLLIMFVFLSTWKLGHLGNMSMYLVLFSLLFLNLFSTETKGAWLGFTAAVSATILLIIEYFLHLEDREVDPKKYFPFILTIGVLFAFLLIVMVWAFVIPMFRGTIQQVGFQILWIPVLLACIVTALIMLWIVRKPWNLKKVVYGGVIFFVLLMGGGVLQYAKTRLLSVSFRMFTWISTWEMVRTSPIIGNGIGTFKVIYPAYRRPQIIVLEGKSNTETDHAEDEYIEVWQDEGIIGFGIFLWLIFTVIALGLKQLRWYSLLRVPSKTKKRALLDIESDPRSYEVLGYLGAYIGALIHWLVDVSVRFVSSGVFSGFLPAVLVAYARNHSKPVVSEIHLPYDRWIRVFVTAVWTAILFWLKIELVPQSQIRGGDTTTGQIVFWILLAGLLIFMLMEFVEWGLQTDSVESTPTLPEPSKNFLSLRFGAIFFVLAVGLVGIKYFGQHFHGDVAHNMAIFFSKESVWTKSPLYDGRMQSYPPDIREKYQKIGGALEHYVEVNKRNHAFPMAYYFTGNVYNDWGSQVYVESVNAKNKGDAEEAARLRDKASDMWKKSEEAYLNTKKLAPNYVQTHHQMGILNIKRAELASHWGMVEENKNYTEEALKNFQMYRMLDPVFPPNYDRIVQILISQGRFQESISLYKEAIYYNDVICRSIHNRANSDRLAPLSISLAKLYFNEALRKSSNPFNPELPEISEALSYFKYASEHDPKNTEAWKGQGYILEKLGRKEEAQRAYQQAYALSPNDPEWKVNAPLK